MTLEIMEEGTIRWTAAPRHAGRQSAKDRGGAGGGSWLEVGTVVGEIYDDDDDDECNDGECDDECDGGEAEEWAWQAYTHERDGGDENDDDDVE